MAGQGRCREILFVHREQLSVSERPCLAKGRKAPPRPRDRSRPPYAPPVRKQEEQRAVFQGDRRCAFEGGDAGDFAVYGAMRELPPTRKIENKNGVDIR